MINCADNTKISKEYTNYVAKPLLMYLAQQHEDEVANCDSKGILKASNRP